MFKTSPITMSRFLLIKNYCNYIHYGLSFNQQMCKLSQIITKIVFVDKLSHFRLNA